MAMKLAMMGVLIGVTVVGGFVVHKMNKLYEDIRSFILPDNQSVNEGSKWSYIDAAIGKFIRKRVSRFFHKKVFKKRSVQVASTNFKKLNEKHLENKKPRSVPKLKVKRLTERQ